RRANLVREALARHAKWLRMDAKGWAVAGSALAQCRCYQQAARWMSGWRNRTDLDLQTLQWLALTLRATGRTKQASEIGSLALAKPGAAEQFPIFKLWLAQDEAFAGNTQDAFEHFREVDITGWDDDNVALHYLVRGVIRVQKADGPYRKEAFA